VPLLGTILAADTVDYRWNLYFGLTGTYYDKDLTDTVLRYDALYGPKTGIGFRSQKSSATDSTWTELSRVVLSLDRPTPIPLFEPYVTKQHTLLSASATETLCPDLPAGTAPNDGNVKIRRVSTFLTLTATNFLLNGEVSNVSGVSWDADDQTGQIIGDNAWRYSRNVLVRVNLDWYLGRRGRHADPFLESKSQRINELKLTLIYEL
jgi:hypothetical protein